MQLFAGSSWNIIWVVPCLSQSKWHQIHEILRCCRVDNDTQITLRGAIFQPLVLIPKMNLKGANVSEIKYHWYTLIYLDINLDTHDCSKDSVKTLYLHSLDSLLKLSNHARIHLTCNNLKSNVTRLTLKDPVSTGKFSLNIPNISSKLLNLNTNLSAIHSYPTPSCQVSKCNEL